MRFEVIPVLYTGDSVRRIEPGGERLGIGDDLGKSVGAEQCAATRESLLRLYLERVIHAVADIAAWIGQRRILRERKQKQSTRDLPLRHSAIWNQAEERV